MSRYCPKCHNELKYHNFIRFKCPKCDKIHERQRVWHCSKCNATMTFKKVYGLRLTKKEMRENERKMQMVRPSKRNELNSKSP